MAMKITKPVRREVELVDGRVAIASLTGHGVSLREKGRRAKNEMLIEWERLFGMVNITKPKLKIEKIVPSATFEKQERKRAELAAIQKKNEDLCKSRRHQWGKWRKLDENRKSRRCDRCGAVDFGK